MSLRSFHITVPGTLWGKFPTAELFPSRRYVTSRLPWKPPYCLAIVIDEMFLGTVVLPPDPSISSRHMSPSISTFVHALAYAMDPYSMDQKRLDDWCYMTSEFEKTYSRMGLVRQAQYLQKATREDIYYLFGQHASTKNFLFKGSFRDVNILRGQHTANQRDVKFPDSTEDDMKDLEGASYGDFGIKQALMDIKNWQEFEALVDKFYNEQVRNHGGDNADEVETAKRTKWDCLAQDDQMSSQRGGITVEPPQSAVQGSISPTETLSRHDSPLNGKVQSGSS